MAGFCGIILEIFALIFNNVTGSHLFFCVCYSIFSLNLRELVSNMVCFTDNKLRNIPKLCDLKIKTKSDRTKEVLESCNIKIFI